MVSPLIGRSLLDISDFTRDEINFLFQKTKALKQKGVVSLSADQFSKNAAKSVALMFFEPSTRTRSSFEMAAFRLGLRVLNLSASDSSVKKGETVYDTAQNIEALKPDIMIVRHGGSGIPFQISKRIKIPVVNAGDGFHAHPTQALLDSFTILEKFSDLKGLRVLIVGDIAHSRVARSNIKCLKMFGANVKVCGPPTLIPPLVEKWGVESDHNLDSCLQEADVVMALRMQLERQSSFQVPSIKEFSYLYGLSSERLDKIKPSAVILHPGPVNRGVELTSSVFRDPRCLVMEQVNNGAFLRQALLDAILGLGEKQGAE